MKPDEILDRAADEILINGHNKGSYGEENGAKCALGALHYVSGTYENLKHNPEAICPSFRHGDLSDVVAARHALEYHVEIGHIPHWNDNPDVSAADVMDAMRMTAKGLRENEG